MKTPTQLYSLDELKSLLGQTTADQPNLRILDASWYLPSAQRNCRVEFAEKHIVGAQFFDIDAVSDQRSDLPHMLPSASQFSEAVGELGINNESTIIVYDSAGLFAAARVWWMFKTFGHQDVRILDGGLPGWENTGGALTNQTSRYAPQNYNASLQPQNLASKRDLIENCEAKTKLVLDARSGDRFYGKAPEPRPGLPSGHMPESRSLPFSQLIEDGKLKRPQQLQALFADVGADANTSIVTTCGSGVTAAIITLALVESGLDMHALYDGAWAEWGGATDTVILDKGAV